MADIVISQTEAEALIAMEKHRVTNEVWTFPLGGERLCIPLQSIDKREQFLLDISRGRIDLMKSTLQTRARAVIGLVRVDLGSAPHRNPDGEEIGSPHIHLYREGFGLKWALPLPRERFPNPKSLWDTLQHFCDYCAITKRPEIPQGLF